MSRRGLNRQTRLWRIMRFLIASSKKHAFLDRGYIAPLFAVTPTKWRRQLALKLLSLSPHYWVYQWAPKYSKMKRKDVLVAEYERNAVSRVDICDKLLRQFLDKSMKIMDFGCGPGFLAKAASAHVAEVIATDVSRGVVACAKELNAASNLTYQVNTVDKLPRVGDASLDLIYSFAVFQHLLKSQAEAFLKEFLRALKPGGKVMLHMILKNPGEARADDPSQGDWITQRTNLRMVYFTPDEAIELLRGIGFENISVAPINTLATINDDIGREQFVIAYRKAEAKTGGQTRRAA